MKYDGDRNFPCCQIHEEHKPQKSDIAQNQILLKKTNYIVNKENLDRGNSKSQGDEAIIYYYVPNKDEEDVLTSDSHETKSDEEQKKEVAIYNIINVTPPLGEMFKDSTPAISDSEDQQ